MTHEQLLDFLKPDSPTQEKGTDSFESWFEKMEAERKQHIEDEKTHDKDNHNKKGNDYDYEL